MRHFIFCRGLQCFDAVGWAAGKAFGGLNRVVPEKGPLKVRVCVRACVLSFAETKVSNFSLRPNQYAKRF